VMRDPTEGIVRTDNASLTLKGRSPATLPPL